MFASASTSSSARLEEPFRQIVFNAGLKPSVLSTTSGRSVEPTGFDARTEKPTDMIEAAIIDPAKVTKQALLNASSIAELMLTEALISEIKEEEKGGGGNPGRHRRHVLRIT
jgi:chaperonin GroEL